MLALVHPAPVTRVCTKCDTEKPVADFTASRPRECKACSRAASAAYRADHLDAVRGRQRVHQRAYQGTVKGMLALARLHAGKRGIEFALELDDIFVPEHCPVLGVRLERGRGKCQDASPTIDRLDSSKGYVRGNVTVISHRANTIKSFGTAEEHERIAAWMRSREGV